jgi:hypothetical protein
VRRRSRPALAALAALFTLALCATASAEVKRVEIKTRADLGGTGYEKIIGTVFFEVDPSDARNRVIADLDKAPRAANGRVEFSADLYILKPKAAGNGAVLVDVLNRGGKPALTGFNRGGVNDPSSEADLGDRFLLRHGFTLAWVGWEFDIPKQPGLMKLNPPIATDNGKTVTGIVHAAFTASTADTAWVVTDLMNYDAVDPDGTDSTLTVRQAFLAKGTAVARGTWHLKGHTVTLDGGFVPGMTYEVSYRAADPPVAGLGLAAVRDVATWLRHDANSLAPSKFAYAFGSSQSGRFLREFLYDGFNTDERDRQVFDGVMPHIAGASRIDLNARWSAPRGLGVYGATAFPFADARVHDPISGLDDGLLDNPRAKAHQPRVFYTNTPVEYWGTGRVAALVHTSPDGKTDLPLPENVRVYFFAGTQHGPARFPPEVGPGRERANPVDYWWTMRALLLAMHRWVSEGVPPPPSSYPTLRDGTLVAASSLGFPAIPGSASPRELTAGFRIANPLLPDGAGPGAALPLLVPAVDADGNERAGIRLPDVAVPLGTYTGWNFRHVTTGSPFELVSLLGSFMPLAATKADRASSHDPRRAVEERYASRDAYLAQARQSADALVQKGYLLNDDVPRVMQRAGDTWDLVTHAGSRSQQR